ncbi:hypothetical protein [Mesobacterium pallidum]|uniref:hypothetical protein n=1 Tax=Mesobacterium pallidum TaxID=2872037 RepID=UPI001EE26C6E|nr:hypothetical protein [Mesobacterium pallidum]
MTSAARFYETDISRLIKAARKAGLKVRGVAVTFNDEGVRIETVEDNRDTLAGNASINPADLVDP